MESNVIKINPSGFPECKNIPPEIILNSIKYSFFLLLIVSIYLLIKKKVRGWYWVIIIATVLFALPHIYIFVRIGFKDWLTFVMTWWRIYCL